MGDVMGLRGSEPVRKLSWTTRMQPRSVTCDLDAERADLNQTWTAKVFHSSKQPGGTAIGRSIQFGPAGSTPSGRNAICWRFAFGRSSFNLTDPDQPLAPVDFPPTGGELFTNAAVGIISASTSQPQLA